MHDLFTKIRLYSRLRKQRGAVLMVMLVILIIGATVMLLRSLNSTTPRISRDRVTADALAQAKEALIGYALTDSNRPGELPCPDVDGDGTLTPGVDYTSGGTNPCIAYVGYLPWKKLGLPELHDGSNSKLWYALSKNFQSGNSVVLNSDTPGQLSIVGNINLGNVAAIIFSPGAPLCGKSHSNNNLDQYLEAMSSINATSAVIYTSSNDCANTPYNDNFLPITAEQLLQPVEKRIAGEIKNCLDDYAAVSAQKYPWAAPISPIGNTGTFNTLFGRVPDLPITSGDSSMSPTWPATCTLFSSSYWADWKSLAFYQVSDGFKPGVPSPACGTTCLSIAGSGNSGSGSYRAVIAIAGKSLPSQSRLASTNPNDFLSNSISEGATVSALVANAHSSVAPTTTFKTYNLSDPDYININDLVLCLDGKNNCK